MALDLSDADTPEEAARALHEYLTETFEADGAHLWSPDENPRGPQWAVSWEGGPFEWAVKLTGGESMIAGWPEMAREDHEPSPEVTGFYADNGWFAEPHYSFDLQFYEVA